MILTSQNLNPLPCVKLNKSQQRPVQMHNAVLDHMSIMMPCVFCLSANVRAGQDGEWP